MCILLLHAINKTEAYNAIRNIMAILVSYFQRKDTPPESDLLYKFSYFCIGP